MSERPLPIEDEQDELTAPAAEAAAPTEVEVEEAPAEEDELPRLRSPEHAAGDLRIPDGYGVIEGEPTGNRRAVGIETPAAGQLCAQLLGEEAARFGLRRVVAHRRHMNPPRSRTADGGVAAGDGEGEEKRRRPAFLHPAMTKLTSRRGTTTTFLTVFPCSQPATLGSCAAISRISASPAVAATCTSPRSLPLTCTAME